MGDTGTPGVSLQVCWSLDEACKTQTETVSVLRALIFAKRSDTFRHCLDAYIQRVNLLHRRGSDCAVEAGRSHRQE